MLPPAWLGCRACASRPCSDSGAGRPAGFAARQPGRCGRALGLGLFALGDVAADDERRGRRATARRLGRDQRLPVARAARRRELELEALRRPGGEGPLQRGHPGGHQFRGHAQFGVGAPDEGLRRQPRGLLYGIVRVHVPPLRVQPHHPIGQVAGEGPIVRLAALQRLLPLPAQPRSALQMARDPPDGPQAEGHPVAIQGSCACQGACRGDPVPNHEVAIGAADRLIGDQAGHAVLVALGAQAALRRQRQVRGQQSALHTTGLGQAVRRAHEHARAAVGLDAEHQRAAAVGVARRLQAPGRRVVVGADDVGPQAVRVRRVRAREPDGWAALPGLRRQRLPCRDAVQRRVRSGIGDRLEPRRHCQGGESGRRGPRRHVRPPATLGACRRTSRRRHRAAVGRQTRAEPGRSRSRRR